MNFRGRYSWFFHDLPVPAVVINSITFHHYNRLFNKPIILRKKATFTGGITGDIFAAMSFACPINDNASLGHL
jgi:hypothetical protein